MELPDEIGGHKVDPAYADAEEVNTARNSATNEKAVRKRRKFNPRNNFGGTTADGNSDDDETKDEEITLQKATNDNDKYDSEYELKITVADLNKHFTCSICHGYFRDAHTISECLHTFCKLCLYVALCHSNESKCPLCSTDLGPSPQTKIVVDRQLQSFVDKLATRKITSIV